MFQNFHDLPGMQIDPQEEEVDELTGIPHLARVLRKLDYGNIYVAGSRALWEWLGGAEWKPNDTDIFINHRRGQWHDVRRQLYDYQGVELPDTYYPTHNSIESIARLARNRRQIELCTTRRGDSLPTQVHSDTYDVIEVAYDDFSQYLTDQFDLDVCAVAYEVKKWDIIAKLEAYYTLLLCLRRISVAMPVELRKLIFSWALLTSPEPAYFRQWIYGRQFNRDAALKKPGSYAVLHWKRSSAKESTTVNLNAYRGIHRARKYEGRGFMVSEYPSRALDLVSSGLLLDAMRWRAYKKRKRKQESEIERDANVYAKL